MYAIGNTISIVKKYQININLKVESVYKIPKALEIDLSLLYFWNEPVETIPYAFWAGE